MKPSISYTNPFTTPECIDSEVEFPIKCLGFSNVSKGNFAVKLCNASYLNRNPGEIAPPR